jgi:guanine deaminase
MGPDGWLESYTFPAESKLTGDRERALDVYGKVVGRTLKNGTTSALYFGTIDVAATKILADVCVAKGQRGFVGKVCMDRNSPQNYSETCEEGLAGTVELIE